MKKIDEIKAKRMERLFNRRMDKAKEKKKLDVVRELEKHSSLISDEKVKNFIEKKKEVNRVKELAKYQPKGKKMVINQDIEMESEESENEKMQVLEKIKAKKKKTKAIKK